MRLIQRGANLIDFLHVGCNLPDDEWEQIVKFGGTYDVDALANRLYAMPGEKWCYEAPNEPDLAVMVGGYVPIRAGVYATWFLATRSGWSKHGRELTRIAIERQRFMLKSGAHRLETVCLASRTLAHRWYKTIGLRLEATQEGYCVDGSDAALFVAGQRKH